MLLRDVRLPADEGALRALDTSFTTDVVCEIVREGDAFLLHEVPVAVPVTKRFPLEDFGRDRAWDRGLVATEGEAIVGFVATRYEAWHRRLVIHHLYVDAGHRRRGIGRRLLEAAIRESPVQDARTAWVETSHLNVPGLRAYAAMGFEICGFDLTLYRGTDAEGEVALFLARDPVASQ